MFLGFNAGEIIQIAVEIEENGRFFYEKAKNMAFGTEPKAVFAQLEEEEGKHRQLFLELKSRLPETALMSTTWDPHNETDQYLKMMADMNVFKSRVAVEDLLQGVADVKGALRLGIQFEKDSILFYLLMRDYTEEDMGQGLIDRLISEEKNHLKKLSGELGKYSGRRG